MVYVCDPVILGLCKTLKSQSDPAYSQFDIHTHQYHAYLLYLVQNEIVTMKME